MKTLFSKLCLSCVIVGSVISNSTIIAQNSRTDKLQTYVLENPYHVEKIISPTGKKSQKCNSDDWRRHEFDAYLFCMDC